MFYQTATDITPGVRPIAPTELFEGDTMLNPKWGVIAVALAVFALAASYDAQLGLGVGIGLVVIVAIALWIRVRFALQPGESPADRSKLASRFKRLGRNRRAAQAAELRSQSRSEPGEPS
ncbi:MAG: hypothetical protein QNI87_10900 [Erythrobacter sp.]|uniref:hypothetical protein n=1 Tax=Erythrobacter sp. TaxID=1042 RepID=UPI002626133A|nr:hypothetical protein [Erythrobacter sp.]MDJ0979028.1 hypothetical protein [Erythrobacter sp.]